MEKGNLLGSITHSDGSNEKVTFSSDLDSEGIFLSSFVAREPGEVSIQINELTENRQMEAILSVSNKTLEKRETNRNEWLILTGRVNRWKSGSLFRVEENHSSITDHDRT